MVWKTNIKLRLFLSLLLLPSFLPSTSSHHNSSSSSSSSIHPPLSPLQHATLCPRPDQSIYRVTYQHIPINVSGFPPQITPSPFVYYLLPTHHSTYLHCLPIPRTIPTPNAQHNTTNFLLLQQQYSRSSFSHISTIRSDIQLTTTQTIIRVQGSSGSKHHLLSLTKPRKQSPPHPLSSIHIRTPFVHLYIPLPLPTYPSS